MSNNQPISVLHLISSSAFLGAERVVCELASGAVARRVRVEVGVLGSPKPVVESFEAALQGSASRLVYFPCQKKLSLCSITAIKQHLQTSKTDILHLHGYKSDLYGFLAAKLSTVPVRVIATNHTWKLRTWSERLYKYIDKNLLKKFDAIVAVSEEVRKEMIQLGVSAGKISTIYNGVSIDGCWEADPGLARKSLGITENELVVGCVASLTPEKAHTDLLHAFASFAGTFDRARLLLIGDGTERANLVTLAEELGVADRVIFGGQRQDVRGLYAALDVFALVSYAEGLPMAMLEAMAASLPVVVTAVGAVPQVVTSYHSGMVVNPGDRGAIASSLTTLAQDRTLREKLGRNGRAVAVGRYSATQMAADYQQLYEKVMESRL